MTDVIAFDYTKIPQEKQQYSAKLSFQKQSDKSIGSDNTNLIKGGIKMNKFTTGMLIGGAVTMAGIGYMMKDKRAYQKVVKKGKRMVVKAEEAIDDMMDNMMP